MALFRKDRGAAGPFFPSLDSSRFVYSERWEFEPDEMDRRGERAPESVYQQMMSAKPPYLLDDRGQRLLPWAGLEGHSALRSGATSAFFDVLDLPGLGPPRAMTESNLDSSVLLGDLRGMAPLPVAGSVNGMSLSPDGRILAVVDQAGDAALVTFDNERVRRHVTGLGRLAGYEAPQWSPDGQFVLHNTHPHPMLVRMSDGSRLVLPLEHAEVDWWPARGRSTLFVLQRVSGDYEVASFDLATGAFQSLGAVTTPDGRGADPTRLALVQPRVSPGGQEVLLGVPHGPDGGYIDSYAVRRRVGILDVETRSVTAWVSPFIDDDCWIARDHRYWYWLETWPETMRDEVTIGSLAAEWDAALPDSGIAPGGDSREATIYRWVS